MNQMRAEVTNLNTGTVFQSIMSFLNDEGLSPTTRAAYEYDIKLFFKFACGKDLGQLTEEDLLKIENEHVKNYRTHIKKHGGKNGEGLENSSVNRKMRVISSLFKDLAKASHRKELNPAIVQMRKPLGENKNHYGDFTCEEIKKIIEYVRDNKPQGLQKSLLIELAIKTSYRKEYLLNLKWSDIRKHNDDYYIIKGRQFNSKKEEDKTIEREFYERLLTLKQGDRNDTIFHMTGKTASQIIREVVDELVLDPQQNRNLTFHSLKNYGINQVYHKTKDIRLMAKQGNHSPETALGHYSRISDDPTMNPSLLVDTNIDVTPIKEATHEQLLTSIMNSNDYIKTAILNQLKNIMG